VILELKWDRSTF